MTIPDFQERIHRAYVPSERRLPRFVSNVITLCDASMARHTADTLRIGEAMVKPGMASAEGYIFFRLAIRIILYFRN